MTKKISTKKTSVKKSISKKTSSKKSIPKKINEDNLDSETYDILDEIINEKEFVKDIFYNKELIYRQMALTLKDCEFVGKSLPDPKEKASGGFEKVSYPTQTIASLIDSLHNSMKKHHIFLTKEFVHLLDLKTFKTSKGTTWEKYVMKFKFTFHTIDGSFVSTESIGIGIDFANGDKAINKAMSYALKYAIIQTFLIPSTETIDTETIGESQRDRIEETDNIKKKKFNAVDFAIQIKDELMQLDKNIEGKQIEDMFTKFILSNIQIEKNKHKTLGDFKTFPDYYKENLDPQKLIDEFYSRYPSLMKKKVASVKEKPIQNEEKKSSKKIDILDELDQEADKELNPIKENKSKDNILEVIKNPNNTDISKNPIAKEFIRVQEEFEQLQKQGKYNNWKFEDYWEMYINEKKKKNLGDDIDFD